MLILLIDTTDSKNHLSLFFNKTLLSYRALDKKTSSTLLPALNDLFDNSSYLLSDVNIIGVNKGPGGFTSTRIGVMMAKALHYATSIPLIPFTLFDAFSLHDYKKPVTIALLMKSKVWLLHKNHTNNEGPFLVPLTELSKHLKPTHLILSPDVKKLKYFIESQANLPTFLFKMTSYSMESILQAIQKTDPVPDHQLRILYPLDL